MQIQEPLPESLWVSVTCSWAEILFLQRVPGWEEA